MKGWVYIITNKAMPDILKVGFTMKDPDIRAIELNNTGSPYPYIVDYAVLVDDPQSIERITHINLSSKREGKEWFRCTREEAIAAIKTATSNTTLYIENCKHADREKAESIWRAQEAERNRKRDAIKRQKEEEELINKEMTEINNKYQQKMEYSKKIFRSKHFFLFSPDTNFWGFFVFFLDNDRYNNSIYLSL